MIRQLLLPLVVAFLCLTLLLGWLGHVHPAFDSFSHFRLHVLVVLAVVLIVTCFKRRWNSLLAGVATVLISLGLTVDFLPGNAVQKNATGKRVVKVLQFNLFFANSNLSKAHALLSNVDADFVLLQEATRRTRGVLETLKATHPFQHYCKVVGVAIASRHPFSDTAKSKCSPNFGFGSAQFLMDGRSITLASIHLSWPWPRGQSRQVDRLAPRLKQLEFPHIIAGDFNAAPWSHTVQRIAGLTGGKVAPGYRPSWGPGELGILRKSIGLSIDNTIFSNDLAIISRNVLADAGSDHLPMLTTLEWKN